MNIKPYCCNICKKRYWSREQLIIHENRHNSKVRQIHRNVWSCPKCNVKHYDVYCNICPSCGLDFNSEEFNQIARNLGKQRTVQGERIS